MIHNSMGMSPFAIVYRKIPYHLLNWAKLTNGEKFSSATSVIAEQILDVQEEVWLKLEKCYVKCNAATDKKRREKIFCEGDMVIGVLTEGENSCCCQWCQRRIEARAWGAGRSKTQPSAPPRWPGAQPREGARPTCASRALHARREARASQRLKKSGQVGLEPAIEAGDPTRFY